MVTAIRSRVRYPAPLPLPLAGSCDVAIPQARRVVALPPVAGICGARVSWRCMGRFAQVSFILPNTIADTVGNLLAEQYATGWELRDEETLSPGRPGSVELLVWLKPAEVEEAVGRVRRLIDSLRSLGTDVGQWSWASEGVAETDWSEAYKAHFRVNRVGRYFIIKPSWETYRVQPDDIVIELDPGQAFGTSHHASTQLVLRMMERLQRRDPAPPEVLDIGCGSGILAIAAAKLWPAARIIAIDTDDLAVQATTENATRNGVEDRIEVVCQDARDIEGQYELVLANLEYSVLLALQPKLRAVLPMHDGTLVLSGLLADQAKELCLAYSKALHFLPEYTEESEDGWRALLLRIGKPG